ncbi:MAG: hypothetical protein QW667_04725 [Candidatus Bathyarchaeia archaeon]
MLPCGFSDSYIRKYMLLDFSSNSRYQLNVAVQHSLYEYYLEKSHKLSSELDFAKFVTPYSLAPIADCLRKIFPDDEDFANGVLMLVHQIPYEATAEAKYPIETIVENTGDCDLFSFVAASIMKAGGLDVVLLDYESQAHMNVGVSLSHMPYHTREQASYVKYNDTYYFIAECTGGAWESSWRVGECPENLKNAEVKIITLENCETWAPGRVSASYKTLMSSSITLEISSTFLIEGNTLTICGELSPALQGETISIYIKVNNLPWALLGTALTDSTGKFTYIWNSNVAGVCLIRASWSGNEDYVGADSKIQTITILSTFFIFFIVVTAILIFIGVIIFITSSRPKVQGPNQGIQPPEIPPV